MELKSVYGYHVDLFAMIASSRVGGLAHVDVRSYKLSKGGSKPIDESLFDRIGRLLSMWSSLNSESLRETLLAYGAKVVLTNYS